MHGFCLLLEFLFQPFLHASEEKIIFFFHFLTLFNFTRDDLLFNNNRTSKQFETNELSRNPMRNCLSYEKNIGKNRTNTLLFYQSTKLLKANRFLVHLLPENPDLPPRHFFHINRSLQWLVGPGKLYNYFSGQGIPIFTSSALGK